MSSPQPGGSHARSAVAHLQLCLFIDESGNLRDEPSVVAGVLIGEPDVPALDAAFRRLLRTAVPFGAMPIHAAHWGAATYAASAWAVAPGPGDFPGRPLLEQAAHELQRAFPAAWQAALDDAREPRKLQPHIDLSRLLHQHRPDLADGLRAVGRAVLGGISDALAHFAAHYAGDCFVVAAWVEPTPDGEDRYLVALEALLERAYAVLRGAPGQHHAWVIPAVRRVPAEPGFDAVPLRPQDVGRCETAARDFPLGRDLLRGDGAVRLVPSEVRSWNKDVHGGLMVADFVANRLNLPARNASWAELERTCGAAFALPLRHAAPLLQAPAKLPTVAAVGPARDAICHAVLHPDDRPTLPPRPRWAQEQARQWMTALRDASRRSP